jgi:hypothetical protein
LPAGGPSSHTWAVKVSEAIGSRLPGGGCWNWSFGVLFPLRRDSREQRTTRQEMGYGEWCRATAAITGIVLLSPFAEAQHTLIKRDGSQWSCQVKGVSGGNLRYALDPSSAKTLEMPCADVLAYIDESLIVHQDACDAAMRPPATSISRNCASLVAKDRSVIKGDITQYMDDYFKLRTLQGEKTVTMSDVVVHITEDGEIGFTNNEALKEMLADRTVVMAMNNTGQCPASAEKALTKYSEKNTAKRFQAKLNAAVSKPKVIKPGGPVPDTTNRGLLKTLDFDTFKTIAMDKVKRLEDYIGKIVSPTLSPLDRDKAVKQAVDLFMSEKNIVQTSNVRATGPPTKKDWPVGLYFKVSLRGNKAQVKIDWTDLAFASDWEMQEDSSYRATISIQQRYIKEVDGHVVYSDVTNKNIDVIISAHDKFVDGRFEKWWDVFLGDIGVTSSFKG